MCVTLGRKEITTLIHFPSTFWAHTNKQNGEKYNIVNNIITNYTFDDQMLLIAIFLFNRSLGKQRGLFTTTKITMENCM